MVDPDLTQTQRNVVCRIVGRHLPRREVRVFGSRAGGDPKPWSDLDLAVLGTEPVSDLALAEARADFEESDLPFRVDLVLLRDLPQPMRASILRDGMAL